MESNGQRSFAVDERIRRRVEKLAAVEVQARSCGHGRAFVATCCACVSAIVSADESVRWDKASAASAVGIAAETARGIAWNRESEARWTRYKVERAARPVA